MSDGKNLLDGDKTTKENGTETIKKSSNGRRPVKKTASKENIAENENLMSILSAINESNLYAEFAPDGTILTLNKMFLDFFGIGESDMIGKNHGEFSYEKQKNPKAYKDMWIALNKGISQKVDTEIRLPGKTVYCAESYTPILDRNKKVTKIILISSDITASKIQEMEVNGQMEAINSSSAFIEFNVDGIIQNANDLFQSAMQYSLEDIVGQHHRIFCEKTYAGSSAYKKFWKDLKEGKAQSGEFKRLRKDGSEIWLLAHYTPVIDADGNVMKIIKLATDITEQKLQNADYSGQLEAIGKSNAVIEFELDGTILTANDNFLQAIGYSLDEIQGQHHKIFVEDSYARGAEYKDFWTKLNNGEFFTGEFKRIAKGGREIWIQASYNPIFDLNGNPFKVVKYATDITEQKTRFANFSGQMEAVDKSYGTIEFDMGGNILQANKNFLSVVGYSLEEIQGKHHRIFVEKEVADSKEYADFWAKLNRGEFDSATYQRVGKNGKEIYIQATYNPIFDLNGVPVKVVKYATDITEFTQALKAVSGFVSKLRDGDFEADITMNTDGDIGRMIEDNLMLRDTIKSILADVNQVVIQAGEEGNLNARLNTENQAGTWKNLVDSINGLIQSVAEPMFEFNSIINKMAEGDLTQKFNMKSSGDIKEMADALNSAIQSLNDILSQINSSTNVVASSSTNMLSKSESVKNNANEVASAISQMAKGAQDQAAKTDESSKLVNQVLETANEMENRAEEIFKTAESGQQRGENGLKIVANLVENMSEISSSANLTSDSIKVLTERAEEIARTLNVITDIAAQTNLLALNAAIEAARAGDAGRGFAVVAEEIRKLAEDSRKSAVDIEKIIGDVQKDTQAAGKAIDNMNSSVKDGNKATGEAEGIFQDIAAANEQTLNYSQEIRKSTSEQKESIDEVVKNIEQIVVVAEETAAGTQQVASSSQQLNANMNEITSSSNQLSDIAEELQEGVKKFKL